MAHQDSIFIITEGKKSDRWLYDGTLSRSAKIGAVGVRFYPIESIAPGGAAGKEAVLKVFGRLRTAKKLTTQNSTGKKLSIFCVDADHDHITARKLRSPHLIYTKLPDAEAHILEECDLLEVVANVASMPKSEARQTLAAFGSWQEDLARGWREWMILCCTGKILGLRNCPAPGTPPKRTIGRMGPVRADAISDLRASINAQLTTPDLIRLWTIHEKRVTQRVDRIMARGEYHFLLKGKWCLKQLKNLTESHGPVVTGHDLTLSEDSFLSAAKAHCTFATEWHQAVRSKVEDLI
jgi:hypothetical protein